MGEGRGKRRGKREASFSLDSACSARDFDGSPSKHLSSLFSFTMSFSPRIKEKNRFLFAINQLSRFEMDKQGSQSERKRRLGRSREGPSAAPASPRESKEPLLRSLSNSLFFSLLFLSLVATTFLRRAKPPKLEMEKEKKRDKRPFFLSLFLFFDSLSCLTQLASSSPKQKLPPFFPSL